MNSELIKSFENISEEDLFYYFKHDGAYDFEKKVIAGIVLHKKGFDKKRLVQEKKIIIDSINDRLKISDNESFLEKKNKKKVNLRVLYGFGYLIFFFLIGVKDYWLDKEIDWVYLSLMLSVGFIWFGYSIINYGKKLQKLIQEDIENNDLLKSRLRLLDKEWRF